MDYNLFLKRDPLFFIYTVKKYMPYKKIPGIYKITNNLNGKVYIGSSVSILNRIAKHKQLLLDNKHFNKHLQSSFNMHGANNFSFDILEKLDVIDKDLLKEREEYNILFFKSNEKDFGYNSRIICDTNLGKKYTEEQIENLRKSHLGIRQTKESIEKIRETLYKEVYKIGEDKKIICKYKSLIDAGEKNNIHRQSISSCCRGILNSTGGFFWCFVDDYDKKEFKKIKKSEKHTKHIYKNIETGEIYRLIDISNLLNINKSSLYQMFIGKQKNKTKFIMQDL